MTDDFASKVTKTIVDNAVRPRSRLSFLATRTFFWSITLVAVLIGALAVATLIYYFIDKYQTGGRGFDEMPLDDFFEIVPYIWLVFLAVASTTATLTFRATPRGFLWHPTRIFAATLIISTVCGAILYVSGFGPFLNRELADLSPRYARLIAVEDWRNTSPDQGRLVGESLGLTAGGHLILRDFRGLEWQVNVENAALSLDNPLGSDEDLDISGTKNGPTDFTATAITDWR